ncbi:MAG: hypothetical protein IJE08_00220 [Clostridia bacterium]|nr:hypothetical protein [Clostridia bacterium]
MTENKKIPENTDNKPLTDDQLEKVSGGEDLSLSAVPMIYLKCAVDSRHIWPYGIDVCPVCGSKEFIRTVVPE